MNKFLCVLGRFYKINNFILSFVYESFDVSILGNRLRFVMLFCLDTMSCDLWVFCGGP